MRSKTDRQSGTMRSSNYLNKNAEREKDLLEENYFNHVKYWIRRFITYIRMHLIGKKRDSADIEMASVRAFYKSVSMQFSKKKPFKIPIS